MKIKPALPLSIPSLLPKSIAPCPIADAVMEIRFVPAKPWDHFPGLFAQQFGDLYPKEEDTELIQIPKQFRDRDPFLKFAAYRRLVGSEFAIQIGPRSVGLAINHRSYPGWAKFSQAMAELLTGLEKMKLVREIVRLGIRYINYFPQNIFELLSVTVNVGDTQVVNPDTVLNTVAWDGKFRNQIQISNNARLASSPSIMGSILDIDTTIVPEVPDSFSLANEIFALAHESEKRMFFGLLKQDFIRTLDVTY